MLTFIYFILILGITIFVHELGHFIFAKRAGIYVYEFALGMGPRIFKWKRKNDETEYSIRAIPLGGFVSMAGEQVEDDKAVPNEMKFQNKKTWQKFMSVIAGVLFNFIFAIVILFIMALIYGAPDMTPKIGSVEPGYPAHQIGIEEGDLVLSINNENIDSWDDMLLKLEMNDEGSLMYFKVEKQDGTTEIYDITPKEFTEEDGRVSYKIGVSMPNTINRGVLTSVKYAGEKFVSLIESMWIIITNLITGDLSINKLSGPVGIYRIVGDGAEAGFDSIMFLVAFLSINVGFINFLPIPAFDGGRLIFIIIGAITKKPINPKVENIIHGIGFVLLLGLMLLVTYNDILKLF